MPFPLEPTLSQVDLPVIDISEFPQDLSQLRDNPLLAKLRKACKEWGFFFLVNHGIPVDLLQKAEDVCRDILSLPTEVKDRAITSNPFNTYSRSPELEAFRYSDPTNPASIEQTCAKIYPEGNPIFCETMTTYVSSVSNLGEKITKIILASLGLDANAFYHSHFDKFASVLRINGFPSDKVSIGEEVLIHHTDLGCVTILYQDDVGGLQIRSVEGEWFNVKPLPHSFVINVGDSLKAWSNGKYRSAEHRVVYNGWRDRISIGFFTFFPDETEIWAPVELVDDENPRRYKPFVFSHFMQEFMADKENNERATAIESFAGV
ncbi:hypothetical protein SUGI_0851900 [Cryptomeria japonica]|uniref:2-oxoglutarate-dependent dioxygenase DAO-like n=1 Tax=Cryptomeria japonica TaxID=3369 RepID=UPI0024148677|nr:2-oxoglutarate-dependent dioxygenase DAO-like [Cryptomeria japonica]GLJ41123.1 hypothetical protein SUGI_0851900 [Cryptomeria japonica]